MLETICREPVDRVLISPVLTLLKERVSPSYITLMAVIAGVLAAFFIYLDAIVLACTFLIASGYLDMLDGALARAMDQQSELGSVFDIIGDRVVEFFIFLGLWAHSPLMRGGYVLFMLGATLICVTSFLVVSMFSENKSEKSFHYSPGLMERAEAFIFFFLMILFPSAFGIFAVIFSVLVFYTAFERVHGFYRAVTPHST